MRPGGCLVDPPCLDDLSRLVQVAEQVLAKALVGQTAVEALDEAFRK
jgi:hypothetical protein